MAVSISQTNRLLSLETPLRKDVLLLTRFVASESISRLFHFNLELIADVMHAHEIAMNALIGQPMTIHLALTDAYSESQRRFFNGIVSRFAQGQRGERVVHYQAEVVPWLWLLTLTSDCRVFQGKTVPEIIKLIFDDLKSTYPALVSYRDETMPGKYLKLDYCVQYRETDFNFVSRLMEQEGIFYFFEHEQGKHTLVLTDSSTDHQFCPVEPDVRYQPEAGIGEGEEGIITAWEVEQELRPGKYVLRDYHFQVPSKSLEVTELTTIKVGSNNKNNKLEIYDYPGEYAQRFTQPDERLDKVEPEGRKLVKLRMEEEEVSHSESRGTSFCRDLRPGYCFKLIHHYDSTLDGAYLLTSVQHSAVQTPDYFSNGEVMEPYTNSFTCIPDGVPFRPSRVTPKPVVQGPQTAIVVGKKGEEIWTDRYGRVKVRFHWDREKKWDEDRSCWIRVSHPWAGKNWGAISIPRIGQEVIVDFLEGDPDQPIITGRVYNAEQMPPYVLPAGGVISGIKSNSTKGGGGYNEFILDDTKGNELIRVHGQYDMDTTIEHDLREHVLHDRSRDVTNNETFTIGNNQTETIGGNQTLSVAKNRMRTVTQNEIVTVALTRTHSVGINEAITVGAAQEVTIGTMRAVTVGINQDVNIGSNLSESIGSDHQESVGDNRTTSVGRDDALKVGKNLIIDAGDQIVIKTGQASIAMKKDGTITIEGKDITIKGSGKIVVQASKDMVLKAQKIMEN